MPDVKQLTTEELQQIKDMQAQYNKFVFELGSIEAQIQNLLSAKTAAETEKDNILGDIKKYLSFVIKYLQFVFHFVLYIFSNLINT